MPKDIILHMFRVQVVFWHAKTLELEGSGSMVQTQCEELGGYQECVFIPIAITTLANDRF